MAEHRKKPLYFLDLFAGAGGMSEGFIRAGFSPIAHIEMDEAACYTLKTRMAWHYILDTDPLKKTIYYNYLRGKVPRDYFYSQVPASVIGSVIQAKIDQNAKNDIMANKIDPLCDGRKIDLIIGGPPCQAYSLVGRARDPHGMKNDDRNYLYIYYADFLNYYKPKYFVFENVLGLLSAKDKNGNSYFGQMRSLFEKCGYKLGWELLNADDYGVLQHRRRIILIGKRTKEEFKFPELEKNRSDSKVESIFYGLPALSAGEGSYYECKPGNQLKCCDSEAQLCERWLKSAHIRSPNVPITYHKARPNKANDLAIYQMVAERWKGKDGNKHERLSYTDLAPEMRTQKNVVSFLDRFKVVEGDLPASHTVVAHICKDGHYFIHPDIKQNRSITPREAARLQTFPDDYYFEGKAGKPSQTDAFKQIGNAVPVLLSETVARKLAEIWSKN